MRIHITIYGTKQEIDKLVSLLFIYKDDTVKYQERHAINVNRSGELQPLTSWNLSTRNYTTRLHETIRAFCFLHPHVGYIIKTVDDIPMEYNFKTSIQLHHMQYHVQELSMQDVLLRMRQAVTCLDNALSTIKGGNFTLASNHDTLSILHTAYVEYMYHDLVSCLAYADEHEKYIKEIFHVEGQDDSTLTELIAVNAVQAMCRESIQK